MKVTILGWSKSKYCPSDKNVAGDIIAVEMDVKSPKAEARKINREGGYGIRAGHGVTIVYPSGRRLQRED